MLYNPAKTNYLKEKFKDTMIEYMLGEKSIIHQGNIYLSVMSSSYGDPQKFQDAWHHKYLEEI